LRNRKAGGTVCATGLCHVSGCLENVLRTRKLHIHAAIKKACRTEVVRQARVTYISLSDSLVQNRRDIETGELDVIGGFLGHRLVELD